MWREAMTPPCFCPQNHNLNIKSGDSTRIIDCTSRIIRQTIVRLTILRRKEVWKVTTYRQEIMGFHTGTHQIICCMVGRMQKNEEKLHVLCARITCIWFSCRGILDAILGHCGFNHVNWMVKYCRDEFFALLLNTLVPRYGERAKFNLVLRMLGC